MNVREILERHLVDAAIVRVAREGVEEGAVDGYVVGCGAAFFALEVFDDASRLDGYSCMRYVDVSECGPAPNAEFRERALAARRISRCSEAQLDLSSVGSLVQSAADVAPLVTLFFEVGDENYCYVGRIVSVSGQDVRYLYISPGGVWDDEPSVCGLASISRIDVGGAYQETLFLVAGRH